MKIMFLIEPMRNIFLCTLGGLGKNRFFNIRMSEEGIFLLYRLCGFIDDLKVIHIYSLFPHMTKTEYNQPNMK